MYIHRAAEDTIQQISKTFPILLITGPRQTGKTTTLRYLAKNDETSGKKRTYVTLDNPEIRALAKSEPELFLQRYKTPLLIDEIQYAPELFPYIKMAVDADRQNGAFWLTGSQSFLLMKNVSESLAGRVGIVTLLGLSQSEINSTPSLAYSTEPEQLLSRINTVPPKTVDEIYQMIFRGSMPELYANPEISREQFYAAYIQTYLLRDVNDLTQIGDKDTFYRFLVAVAARTGHMLVYDDLAKDVGISAPTAKRWISILTASHIICLVQPYYNNALKRMVKSSVVHFLDTGLCSYLLRWDSPENLERGAVSGNILESFVFTEVYKSYLNAGIIQPPLYYYRDTDKREIDLLIVANNTISPIEIKKTAAPDKKTVSHIRYVREKLAESNSGVSVGVGSVLCLVRDIVPLTKEDWAVPVWVI